VLSPCGGVFTGSVAVAIRAPGAGAHVAGVFYTTDGSDPVTDAGFEGRFGRGGRSDAPASARAVRAGDAWAVTLLGSCTLKAVALLADGHVLRAGAFAASDPFVVRCPAPEPYAVYPPAGSEQGDALQPTLVRFRLPRTAQQVPRTPPCTRAGRRRARPAPLPRVSALRRARTHLRAARGARRGAGLHVERRRAARAAARGGAPRAAGAARRAVAPRAWRRRTRAVRA